MKLNNREQEFKTSNVNPVSFRESFKKFEFIFDHIQSTIVQTHFLEIT